MVSEWYKLKEQYKQPPVGMTRTKILEQVWAVGDKRDEFYQIIVDETGVTNPRVIVKLLEQYVDIKNMVQTTRFEPDGMYLYMKKLFDKRIDVRGEPDELS